SLAKSPAEVRVSEPSRRDASIGTEGCDLLPGVHRRSVLRAPGARSARLRRACWLRSRGCFQGLKAELDQLGLIATEGRGEKLNFVVKRQIPGLGRRYVVALTPPKRA